MLHSQEESPSRFGSRLVLATLAAAGLAWSCAEDDGASKTTDAVTPSSPSPTLTSPQTTTDGEPSNGNPEHSPQPTSVNASGGSGGMGSEVEAAGGNGGSDADSEPESGAGGSTDEPTDAGVDGDSGDVGSEEPHQFKIEFDYRFDSTGYFTPERRTLLEYGASLWADVIRDDFEEIPAETPVRLRNIQDLEGEPIVLVIEEPIDDLRLYVNCSSQLEASVGGHTQALATLPDLWGEAFKERLRERFGGTDHEPWAVAVTFNCNEPFFFDESSPQNADDLGGDQADFLSTALHEIGHALGLGISITFDNLRSGDEFLGENSMELFGGPVPMVPGSGHVVEGTLIDGGRVLMDLSRERGTRDLPSALDLAMLKDIGYEVVE